MHAEKTSSDYTVRRSPRATQIRVTVSPRHGVVVTAPLAATADEIESAVATRQEWIEDALAHFGAARETWTAQPLTLLPREIDLPATGEHFEVAYRPTPSAHVRVVAGKEALELVGAVDDGMACLRALQRWLHRHAVTVLVPWLNTLAEKTGADPLGVGVRGQYARWGGCSERGFVTLNRALLFLPRELVFAVMLHELAHLAHSNHSPAFWQHLARLDQQWSSHRERIAAAWDLVPPWAERR